MYEITRYSIKYLNYCISTFIRCIYFPPEKSPQASTCLLTSEDMKSTKMPSLLHRAYYCLWRLMRRQIRYYYYYRYSALGPVWAETRVQPGDWYGSGTLHPGQVLRGSLPLLSPEIRYIYIHTYTYTHTLIYNFMFFSIFCTVYCNIIVQYKPTKCTFVKLTS